MAKWYKATEGKGIEAVEVVKVFTKSVRINEGEKNVTVLIHKETDSHFVSINWEEARQWLLKKAHEKLKKANDAVLVAQAEVDWAEDLSWDFDKLEN